MTATNHQPAKAVEGVIEATRALAVWAREHDDATATAAVKAITHHNWHANTMPSPGKYTSAAAQAALDAVTAGDLPREAFNNEADGLLDRTTTGRQAALTLKLLYEAGAPTDLLTVLTDAYGVDVLGVASTGVHSPDAEYGAVRQNRSAGPSAKGFRRGGVSYVAPTRAVEAPEVESTIFLRNPDLIDRGTTAHMDIQDTLAGKIRANGLLPVSPDRDDQQFDVAWVADDALYICEVKSLTDENEESQLRLGLGQLLSYLYRTRIDHWTGVDEIRGVLAVERPPIRPDWEGICAENGVTLTWPDRFPELFQD